MKTIKKNVLAFLLVAILSGVVALSCSDGKLNLLLVSRTDVDDGDLPELFHIYSSITAKVSSSSVAGSSFSVEPSSSSEEPLSSGEEPSSSSPEPSSSSEAPSSSSSAAAPSSSSRGQRSSSSISTVDFPPPLEEGDPGVIRAQAGGITRYWDGCKPSCSFSQNVFKDDGVTRSPHGIARNCDRNGNEMPLFYRMNPVSPYFAEYIHTPNACVSSNIQEWVESTTYTEWKATHPNFPTNPSQSAAYICSDEQIPYAVNDTLAYAFVANHPGNCGKCFQLQFRSDWEYGAARPSHRAIAGKTLIVMVNNWGVSKTGFDIMIPGGGLGAYDAFSEKLGTNARNLGHQMGGLLAECVFGDRNLPYSDSLGGLTPHERATLEESQECLRVKCNRVFKNHPKLLEGCLWHVNWFMAVDNPEALMKEVDCPKYLIDRYGSTLPFPTRPADLIPSAGCNVGPLTCETP